MLNSGDASLIGALSREEVLGDMFYAGALGYFGEYLGLSHVSALSQQARHGLLYGYGTLGYEPNIQMLFGLPRAITPGGIGVNVRLSWANQPKDGDMVKWRNLNRQSGILASSLEHGVPEQMFSTPTQPAQGVSAVKALQLAAQQGQRIYHITQQNQAQTLPNLHVSGLAMTEIQKGLATGKEVIAHTDQINVSGWVGEGYLILDPETGSGAYKITGGSNGGFLIGVATGFFLFLSLMAAVVMAGTLVSLIAVVAAVAWFIVMAEMSVAENAGCFATGFALGIGLFADILGTRGLGTLLAIMIGWEMETTPISECLN